MFLNITNTIVAIGLSVISWTFPFLSNWKIDQLLFSKKSPLNNEIRCYKAGNSGSTILLIGCIHGPEKNGITTSIRVLNELFAKKDLKNTLICIPTVNPDGNINNTRTNSNKIDINRNFPATNWKYQDSAKLKKDKKTYWGGKFPASEAETRLLMKLDSIYKPSAIIVLHQFLNCVEYDGTGSKLAQFISSQTGQVLKEDIGYSTPGSLGSYFGGDFRREVVTIEIPKNPSDTLQNNLVKALVDVVEKGY